ncbi:hypothetical protein TUMEXPCC7403_24180 [Tumidithrix helvetica PCC 7403]|uniref:hypothetical protein n=1 Tax=Tumidithrix helvetica TaxID=3457545 RepID=UPI003CA568D3
MTELQANLATPRWLEELFLGSPKKEWIDVRFAEQMQCDRKRKIKRRLMPQIS